MQGYAGHRQQLKEFNRRIKEVSYLEGHFKTGKDWKGSRKGNMNLFEAQQINQNIGKYILLTVF